MKIIYCRNYEKYVSKFHCEFFNEGQGCVYHTPKYWLTIKRLIEDRKRPKWEVNIISKPFKCDLMNHRQSNLAARNRFQSSACGRRQV